MFDKSFMYDIAYKYLLKPIDFNMLATQDQKSSKFWYYPTKNYRQILPVKKHRAEDYIAFPPVKNDNIFDKLTVEKLQIMESDKNIWKDKMINVWEDWYLILTTNDFSSPKEKKIIQKKIKNFEVKNRIAPKTPRGTAQLNEKKVERFSSFKFRSSLNQGRMEFNSQSAKRGYEKRKTWLGVTKKKSTTKRLESNDDLFMESEFSFDSNYVHTKSNKYINPILKKYENVPIFKV